MQLNCLQDWVATRVDFAMFRIYASPGYLKKAPPLKTPEDLRHHNCIQMHLEGCIKPLRWPLVINNKIVYFDTQGDTTFFGGCYGSIPYGGIR